MATRVDGSLYYLHQDLLGSTVAVSDAAGDAVGRVQYAPYGEVPTWSVFWERGASATSPPDSGNLWVGKMVGEDSDTDRANEVLGVVVIEEGALTVGMLNTLFIAAGVPDLPLVQATQLYAHEFGHLLFGKDRPVECTIDSIEQEHAAESLAARVWVEMHPDATSEEHQARVGWILDQPVEAAYERIRGWGAYYAVLPEKQPRWYQVWLYWRAVVYILKIALRVRQGEGL